METELNQGSAAARSQPPERTGQSRTTTPEVFVWATGQDDNIGDSLLRRAYLDALRQLGSLHVWSGPASKGFSSGLGLKPDDRQLSSFREWYGAALNSSLRRPTFVAMNAGEVPVSRKGAARLAALALLATICRVRGGGGLWVGAGVPSSKPGLVLAYKAAARACVFVRWREPGSEAIVVHRGTAPDWAFALGDPTSDWLDHGSRTHMAVVLRGDRQEPTAEWIAWVKQLSDTLKLRPTLVVQVKRDCSRAAELADKLGAGLLAWDHEDHATQENAVRDLYGQSALVVGDRLHGLIVAATEGAVPLGWVESSKGKVGRHFKVVGLDWVGRHEGSAPEVLPVPTVEELAGLANELKVAVETARQNLVVTSEGIRQTLPAN